jgi:hypothetical protein
MFCKTLRAALVVATFGALTAPAALASSDPYMAPIRTAHSDACNYNTGYTITTNNDGVGNASITLPQNGQTYWVFDGLEGGGSCCDFFGLHYWESLPITLP